MRHRFAAVLAAALLLGTAASAAAAGTLAITSPVSGATIGPNPTFEGTAFTDGGPSVTLEVSGPTAFFASSGLDGDGGWAASGRPLAVGSYSAVVCQNDAGGARVCSAPVSFKVSSAGGGSFTAKPPQGTFKQLLAGKLSVPVHCPEACTVAARLIVAAKDARRMALPSWQSNQLLAIENDEDSLPAGNSRLGLTMISAAVARQMRASLAFPVLGNVGIKVELQADWGDGAEGHTSVTGRLRWPSVPGDRGGRGGHGLVRSISGPTAVPLGTATGTFSVRLAPLPAGAKLQAGVRTAGGLLSTESFELYAGSRRAGPAALRRGGTFTMRVPLKGPGLQQADRVAPLPAEVYVRVLGRSGKRLDRGFRRFTISR